jgi:hypothetical protein
MADGVLALPDDDSDRREPMLGLHPAHHDE